MKLYQKKSTVFIFMISLGLMAFTFSCKSNKEKGQKESSTGTHTEVEKSSSHGEVSGEHHEHEGEEHEHHEEGMSGNQSGKVIWEPSGKTFSHQLKLEKGSAEALKAKVVTENGDKVLSLEANGNNTLMLMQGDYTNLGAKLQFKQSGFQGSIALVFHYMDDANYDALVLDNNSIALQRVEDGNTEVLDSEKSALPVNWTEMKLSAAGEHLKGFLNGKQYNHGHAEVSGAGKVGIMIDGEGKILLKKLTLVPLEE